MSNNLKLTFKERNPPFNLSTSFVNHYFAIPCLSTLIQLFKYGNNTSKALTVSTSQDSGAQIHISRSYYHVIDF